MILSDIISDLLSLFIIKRTMNRIPNRYSKSFFIRRGPWRKKGIWSPSERSDIELSFTGVMLNFFQFCYGSTFL